MKYIKQYGAQRTGTNYIKWLLQINWPQVSVLTNIFGSKHGPHIEKIDWSGKGWIPKEEGNAELAKSVTPEIRKAYDNEEIYYLVIVKDPYGYYWSNKRQWFTTWSEDMLHKLINAWNMLYRDWVNLVNKKPTRSILIRHEDLLSDLKGTLDKVARKFQLPVLDRYNNTQKPMKPLNDEKWDKEKKFHSRRKLIEPNFYIGRKYLNDLKDEEIRLITEFLDMDLVQKMGYTMGA